MRVVKSGYGFLRANRRCFLNANVRARTKEVRAPTVHLLHIFLSMPRTKEVRAPTVHLLHIFH